MVEHTISTGDAKPVMQGVYQVPVTYRDKVRQELKEMEEAGIIEPTRSPWSSPMVTVRKRDSGLRLCGD